ncbi:Myblike DNAbinding domain-containing protein [Podila epigama]|nr:Myblike DNAbinding domain-containing protein [Podila epigama]
MSSTRTTASILLHLRQKLLARRLESGCLHLSQSGSRSNGIHPSNTRFLFSRACQWSAAAPSLDNNCDQHEPHHRYTKATTIEPPPPRSALHASLPTTQEQVQSFEQPWTPEDDKMLEMLYKKKKLGLAQIQIYMPHQPVHVIEAKLKAMEQITQPKPTFQRWTPQEDQLLAQAVRKLGTKNWKKISESFFSPESKIAAIDAGTRDGGSNDNLAARDMNIGTDRTHSPLTTIMTRRSPRSCQIRWKFLNADICNMELGGGVDSAMLPSSPGSSSLPSSSLPSSSATSTKDSESQSSLSNVGHEPAIGSGGYRQGAWTDEEIELFRELVNLDRTIKGANNWEAISQAMGTRSAIQCHSQFKTVMHSGTKGKWTSQEIDKLREAVALYGRDWQAVSHHVGTRAPDQVRQKSNQMSAQGKL